MGRPPRGGQPSAASANLPCYPMSSVRLLDQFRISAAMRPYVSRVRLRGSDFAKARRAKSRLADKSSRIYKATGLRNDSTSVPARRRCSHSEIPAW